MNKNKFLLASYVDAKLFPLVVTEMTWENNLHDDSINLHSHDFSEIAILIKGSITHKCNGRAAAMTPGDFFVIHPGIEHSYSDMTPGTVLCNILYDSNIVIPMVLLTKSPLLNYLYPNSAGKNLFFHGTLGNVTENDLVHITYLYRLIHTEQKDHRPGYQTLAISLFTSIMILLSYHCKEKNAPIQDWGLNKTIALMKNHLQDKNFTIPDLAKKAGTGIRTLQRTFKGIYGFGPTEYMQRLRVAHAVSLLQTTAISLDQIAERSGFGSCRCMRVHFMKHLRCFPADIRSGKVKDIVLT